MGGGAGLLQVLDLVGAMFVHIFKGLTAKYANEIAVVNQQFERSPFKWLEPTYVGIFGNGKRGGGRLGASRVQPSRPREG